MKSSMLILSVLLLSITTKPLFAKGEPVLDTDGNPLLSNGEYYLLPSPRVVGLGGARAGRAGNSVNQVNVLQGSSRDDLGDAVKFTPIVEIGIIEEGAHLIISFAHAPDGVTSAKWITVADSPGRQTVGIGGPEDHQGYQTFTGFFKLNKASDGYYTVSFVSDISGAHTGALSSFLDVQEGIIRPFVAGSYGLSFVFQKLSVARSSI